MEPFPIMRKMERFKMAGSTAGMEEALAKTAFCRQAGRRSTGKDFILRKKGLPRLVGNSWTITDISSSPTVKCKLAGCALIRPTIISQKTEKTSTAGRILTGNGIILFPAQL